MKREFLYGVIMASVTFVGTMADALAEPLDVKPGLWETTIHSEAHGQLPMSQAQMQKMSPRQRAALEKMQARNSQPHTTVIKVCLTQQKLDKGENAFLAGKPGMKCDSQLSRHTRTSVAGTRHCTKGSMQQTEDFDYEVQDREHVNGKLNITIRNGTNTMSSKGNISSRWISASCGKTP